MRSKPTLAAFAFVLAPTFAQPAAAFGPHPGVEGFFAWLMALVGDSGEGQGGQDPSGFGGSGDGQGTADPSGVGDPGDGNGSHDPNG